MNNFFVAAFLYNPKTREVLLQKRDMKAQANPGLWGFFGGSSEGDETPPESLFRELKEELGIEIDINQIVLIRNYFNEKFQRQSYI
jgi:8-oxo-dGTP diphosphatase